MNIIDKFRLTGKAAFVTGGARGIGKAIAAALAEAGSRVALADLDEAGAIETAESIAAATDQECIAVKTDVTNPDDVQAMVDAVVRKFGRLDIAFCNAGICINAAAEEMSLEQWKKVIDINLTGVFLTSQAAARIMLKQGGGSIINTASMSAHIVNVPQPQCAYNASKEPVGLTSHGSIFALSLQEQASCLLLKSRLRSLSPPSMAAFLRYCSALSSGAESTTHLPATALPKCSRSPATLRFCRLVSEKNHQKSPRSLKVRQTPRRESSS